MKKQKRFPDEIQVGFTAGREDIEAIEKIAGFLCASENAAVKFSLQKTALAVSSSISGMKSVALTVDVATDPVNKHFRIRESDKENIRVIAKRLGFTSDRDVIRFSVRYQSKKV